MLLSASTVVTKSTAAPTPPPPPSSACRIRSRMTAWASGLPAARRSTTRVAKSPRTPTASAMEIAITMRGTRDSTVK
jgi:hypothetical protein